MWCIAVLWIGIFTHSLKVVRLYKQPNYYQLKVCCNSIVELEPEKLSTEVCVNWDTFFTVETVLPHGIYLKPLGLQHLGLTSLIKNKEQYAGKAPFKDRTFRGFLHFCSIIVTYLLCRTHPIPAYFWRGEYAIPENASLA